MAAGRGRPTSPGRSSVAERFCTARATVPSSASDGSVESIRVANRGGDWLGKMSPPWTPPVQGARPLRLLVVIDDQDIDVGGDGVQDSELAKLTRELPNLEPVYAK